MQNSPTTSGATAANARSTISVLLLGILLPHHTTDSMRVKFRTAGVVRKHGILAFADQRMKLRCIFWHVQQSLYVVVFVALGAPLTASIVRRNCVVLRENMRVDLVALVVALMGAFA